MIARRSVSAYTGASSGVIAWALMLIFICGVVPAAGALAMSIVSVVAVKAVDYFRESDQ